MEQTMLKKGPPGGAGGVAGAWRARRGFAMLTTSIARKPAAVKPYFRR